MIDIKTITKMFFDKNCANGLWKIHTLFKDDKNYSVNKLIKTMLKTIENEKIVPFESTYIISSFLPPFPSRAFITHIKAVKNTKNIFTQQMLAQRSAPISFYLCVTNQCMYQCLHCSAKGRNEDPELKTDDWLKIIEDIQNMNTPIIGFTGGEPLLREDIKELIKKVDQRSISILFTNGKLLTYEKALDLKEAGLFGIAVSLDSADSKKHNYLRKDEEAFDLALAALRNASQAGLYTMVNAVITKNEISKKNLFSLFKLAKKQGTHEVRILEPISSGALLDNKEMEQIFYSQNDRQKLITIQHEANRMKEMPKISTFAYTESQQRHGCGAGTQHSYISASGDLYPCDFVPISFGKVTQGGITRNWNEMNRVIGKPKSYCFAFKVNEEIIKKSKGKLPLDMDLSKTICLENQATEFPDFYKVMQGKK